MTSTTLIQLFAKPPEPGKVKTRLIPELGEQSATAIYQYCLQSNLDMLQRNNLDFEVWLTRNSNNVLFQGLKIKLQKGENLGQRMLHALSSELALRQEGEDKNVILMGSDCIDITIKTIQRVQHKLQSHDLVIIPALDGGYVLIAAKNAIDSRLFDGIDWSTDRVLLQTLQIAMDRAIATAVLNPLRDIDDIKDVKNYEQLKPFITTTIDR